MKYLLYYILLFYLFSCADQKDKNIKFISLKINAWEKSDYNDVVIYIEKGESKSSVILQYQDSRDSLISKNFDVNNFVFEDLAKQCTTLETINLDKTSQIGFDGKNVIIEFGAMGKSTNYNFREPNTNTVKRDLNKFMKLSKKILLVSNLRQDLLE